MRKGAAKYGLQPMSVSSELMALFTEFSWPGNLRELENVINRLLVMQDEKSIIEEVTVRAVPGISADRAAAVGNITHLGGLKDMVRDLKGEAESVAITQVLEAKGWNRRAAALSLQISYKALLYKIKQYNLAPSSMQMRGYQLDMGGRALRA
jgi:DNA-binding NtrC family response regulator